LTLDAGALIAFQRNDRTVVTILRRAREHGENLTIPAGVVGQVWRDGRTQARLARLLSAATVHVEPLDDMAARAAGQLCGARRTADVIDASVALCARRRGHRVMTSDVDGIQRLDPELKIILV
jgi:predicted nucleic acid-binding protein